MGSPRPTASCIPLPLPIVLEGEWSTGMVVIEIPSVAPIKSRRSDKSCHPATNGEEGDATKGLRETQGATP